jgi:hypothetical protein
MGLAANRHAPGLLAAAEHAAGADKTSGLYLSLRYAPAAGELNVIQTKFHKIEKI